MNDLDRELLSEKINQKSLLLNLAHFNHSSDDLLMIINDGGFSLDEGAADEIEHIHDDYLVRSVIQEGRLKG